MKARFAAAPLAAALALLSGCASKPPLPAYGWPVFAKTDHIRLEGLPAIPVVQPHAQALGLVNFDDPERRESKRGDAMMAGAVGGGVEVGVHAILRLGPVCVILPAVCIGFAGAGAVVGGNQRSVESIPQEQADRLAAIIPANATSDSLAKSVTGHMPRAPAGARDPALVVRIVSVALLPVRNGVVFRVIAQAEGAPAGQRPWDPSVHFTNTQPRPVEEWLHDDGRMLKADLATAIDVLGRHIARIYQPYPARRT